MIATDVMTAAQIRATKEKLKGSGWWKWFPGFWLVKDGAETWTAASLRDAVREVYKGRLMVMEIEPKAWASFGGKDSSGRNMTDWIKSTWKDE